MWKSLTSHTLPVAPWRHAESPQRAVVSAIGLTCLIGIATLVVSGFCLTGIGDKRAKWTATYHRAGPLEKARAGQLADGPLTPVNCAAVGSESRSVQAGDREAKTDLLGTQDALPGEILTDLANRLAQWTPLPVRDEEKRLLADCEDHRLEDFSFLGAVLIAGGTHEADISKFAELLNRHERAARRLMAETSDEWSALRSLFRYLHGQVLTGGYRIEATNPAITLETGQFNCVSATILFKLLAESSGFHVRIQQLPTHAFCRVETATASIPVECTSPRWLEELSLRNPLQLTETRRDGRQNSELLSRVSLEKPAAISAGITLDWDAYNRARTMSETEILGTIYYNRGVDYLFAKKFPEALYVNLVAVRLDPTNRSARDNLVASLNNWAIALAESQRFEEAAERLRWALRCAPTAEPVRANFLRLYRQWKMVFAKNGKAAEFEQHLRHALDWLHGLPDADSLKEDLLSLNSPLQP